MAFTEHGRAAVGGVDVQPHTVPAADVGDVLEGVECADGRGAGAGHHGHDWASLGPQASQFAVEQHRVHPASRSSRPTLTICRLPSPRMPGGPGHAVVRVGVGQQDRAAPALCQPVVPRVASATLRAVSSAVRLASEPPWVTAPAKAVRLPNRWPRRVRAPWPARPPWPRAPSHSKTNRTSRRTATYCSEAGGDGARDERLGGDALGRYALRASLPPGGSLLLDVADSGRPLAATAALLGLRAVCRHGAQRGAGLGLAVAREAAPQPRG